MSARRPRRRPSVAVGADLGGTGTGCTDGPTRVPVVVFAVGLGLVFLVVAAGFADRMASSFAT